jgi:large subunit ribosomal protein L10
VNRAQKAEAVEVLNETFQNNGVVVIAEYKGLTVAEMSDYRSKLRAEGGQFKVTKNRLAKLACKGTSYEGLVDMFKGPIGIAYSEDPVTAAKISYDFAKGNDKLVIVGGGMGENVLDKAGVEALAKLPSLDELRGKIIGVLQAPAQKLAGVTQAPARDLVGVTKAYSEKG